MAPRSSSGTPEDAPATSGIHSDPMPPATTRDSLWPLLTPFRLRGLTLRNRFVMAPMTRSFSPGGIPGPDVAAYYRRRAEGEAGLIITEGVAIPHDAAIGHSGVDVLDIPNLYGDAALAGWRRVVDEVHAAGGLIAPQLWHQGGMRIEGSGDFPDAPSMRPSGLWGPVGRPSLVSSSYIAQVAAPTRPMTDEEIADVVDAYARAAANARATGFDAIAIHGAHGYLIDSFLWRETNRRADRWGGDVTRRSAFAAAVVRAVRDAAGPDMPVILRYSQWKLQDWQARLAQDPAELEAILAPLVDAGVDLFDVSERNLDTPAFAGSPLGLAGWTRKLTGCATMAVGSVGLSRWLFDREDKGSSDPDDNLGRVEARFADGEFDLVGVGRMMITHADWVRRARLGLPFDKYRRALLKELI